MTQLRTGRVALPNKGRLRDMVGGCLRDLGYPVVREARQLVAGDPSGELEFYFQRSSDIASMVFAGVVDAGIADSLDTVERTGRQAPSLGIDPRPLHCYAPPHTVRGLGDLDGQRVATTHPRTVTARLLDLGIRIQPVVMSGDPRVAVAMGIADAYVGVNTTDRGVVIVGPVLLVSDAVLVTGSGDASPAIRALVAKLHLRSASRQNGSLHA